MKKPFKETGLAQFINKVKGDFPEIIKNAAGGFVNGGPVGAVMGAITGGLQAKSENNARAAELLQELELKRMEFEKDMLTIDMEFFKAEVADRDSARNREIQIINSGGKNWVQPSLAFGVVVGFFAMLIYLLIRGLGNMDTEEGFIIGNVIGLAGGAFTTVLAYYFGSSTGSKAKTEEMMRRLGQGIERYGIILIIPLLLAGCQTSQDATKYDINFAEIDGILKGVNYLDINQDSVRAWLPNYTTLDGTYAKSQGYTSSDLQELISQYGYKSPDMDPCLDGDHNDIAGGVDPNIFNLSEIFNYDTGEYVRWDQHPDKSEYTFIHYWLFNDSTYYMNKSNQFVFKLSSLGDMPCHQGIVWKMEVVHSTGATWSKGIHKWFNLAPAGNPPEWMEGSELVPLCGNGLDFSDATCTVESSDTFYETIQTKYSKWDLNHDGIVQSRDLQTLISGYN